MKVPDRMPNGAIPEAAEAGSLPRVLIAEDDSLFRRLLASCLERWGFQVQVAEDGNQAWKALQEPEPPPLLILDWMMPGIDGSELCRLIRSEQAETYSYIILLTAKNARDNLVEGLNAGADDFLTKPFDARELRARLRVGVRILKLQDALRSKEEQLKFAASHDSLTGLWNSGAIRSFLEREVSRSTRTGESLGVLMVDADHFKQVNDTYGHTTGDEVLREIARRLSESTRQYDWVGRYGGEEFMIVVGHCDQEALSGHCERLRAAISSAPIRTSSGNIAITVSIGGAVSATGTTFEVESLVRTADAALYRAKREGRNRVVTDVMDGLAPLEHTVPVNRSALM